MYKAIESLIENTVCEARIDESGEVISYRIRPTDGYKLHETTLDETVIDEETGQVTGKIKLGFTKSYITIGFNYDFNVNNRKIYIKIDTEEDEIIDSSSVVSEIEEKAKAYDILMGVDEG